LKNALANDPNLPPAKNPGLSREPTSVEVEFLPSKKIVKAYLGQGLPLIAKAAGVEIRYKCKKGECGTCQVNFNGKVVKACQSSLPAVSNEKRFQIGIISPK
jgi:succinate dehydrogenase/fumarate reductase-like Fe-S protein